MEEFNGNVTQKIEETCDLLQVLINAKHSVAECLEIKQNNYLSKISTVDQLQNVLFQFRNQIIYNPNLDRIININKEELEKVSTSIEKIHLELNILFNKEEAQNDMEIKQIDETRLIITQKNIFQEQLKNKYENCMAKKQTLLDYIKSIVEDKTSLRNLNQEIKTLKVESKNITSNFEKKQLLLGLNLQNIRDVEKYLEYITEHNKTLNKKLPKLFDDKNYNNLRTRREHNNKTSEELNININNVEENITLLQNKLDILEETKNDLLQRDKDNYYKIEELKEYKTKNKYFYYIKQAEKMALGIEKKLEDIKRYDCRFIDNETNLKTKLKEINFEKEKHITELNGISEQYRNVDERLQHTLIKLQEIEKKLYLLNENIKTNIPNKTTESFNELNGNKDILLKSIENLDNKITEFSLDVKLVDEKIKFNDTLINKHLESIELEKKKIQYMINEKNKVHEKTETLKNHLIKIQTQKNKKKDNHTKQTKIGFLLPRAASDSSLDSYIDKKKIKYF